MVMTFVVHNCGNTHIRAQLLPLLHITASLSHSLYLSLSPVSALAKWPFSGLHLWLLNQQATPTNSDKPAEIRIKRCRSDQQASVRRSKLSETLQEGLAIPIHQEGRNDADCPAMMPCGPRKTTAQPSRQQQLSTLHGRLPQRGTRTEARPVLHSQRLNNNLQTPYCTNFKTK
jgi:hypothetical protein